MRQSVSRCGEPTRGAPFAPCPSPAQNSCAGEHPPFEGAALPARLTSATTKGRYFWSSATFSSAAFSSALGASSFLSATAGPSFGTAPGTVEEMFRV